MVFQNYALYPHMTVADNMGFALKMQNVPKAERDQRVAEAAKLLGLEPFLDRKPKALSGGQRQRVAMGRAIVRQPQVFLMDEPLSNLDAKLRVSTRTQIAALQQRLGVTTVYVTHDQVEAMTMGDRVAVMKDGLLQQCRLPADPVRIAEEPLRRRLHRLPRHEPDRGQGRRGRRPGRRLRRPGVPRGAGRAGGDTDLTIGIRPEHLPRSAPTARASASTSPSSRIWAPTPTCTARSHGLDPDAKLTAPQIVARLKSRHPLERKETTSASPRPEPHARVLDQDGRAHLS